MRNNLANKIVLDRLKQSCECIYFEGNKKYLTQECNKCRREREFKEKQLILDRNVPFKSSPFGNYKGGFLANDFFEASKKINEAFHGTKDLINKKSL